MFAIAAHTELIEKVEIFIKLKLTYLKTSVLSDLRSETINSRPPTKLRTLKKILIRQFTMIYGFKIF